ncbi:MAG: metal ABC transporter permease [Puniceicoccales bacterium]|nr:metal ABC transporter permease [Puniceicoccales bacterium]
MLFTILIELFSPDFLLRNALYATLLLAAVAPLAGCFLLMRRAAFLGVALPQVSAAGLCGGWLLLEFNGVCSTTAAASGQAGLVNSAWCLLAAFGAALAALLALAWLERGGGSPDARHGALYVLAGAGTVLLLVYHPHADSIYQGIFRGEVVSVGRGDLQLSAISLLPAGGLLLFFRHEFLWAGADFSFWAVSGRNAMFWNAALLMLIGVVVSTGVFVAGPMVCLGVVLLPAFAAHILARRMWHFFLLASTFGVVGGLAGFAFAYARDWPAGSSVVAADGLLLVFAAFARAVLRWFVPAGRVRG